MKARNEAFASDSGKPQPQSHSDSGHAVAIVQTHYRDRDPVPQFLTISALAGRHPEIETEGALRNRIQKAERAVRLGRATLGQLSFLRCVKRPEGSNRLLIVYPSYLDWLTNAKEGGAQ